MDLNWSEDGVGKDEVDEIIEKLASVSNTSGPSMRHLDHEVRAREFWDSLAPEQLHFIRTIFLSIAQEEGSDSRASYHLGSAEAILRVKYKLCPRCFQSHDSDEALRKEVDQAKQNYRAVCTQYDVTPEDDSGSDFKVGRVRCNMCPTSFESLLARIDASARGGCPGCSTASTARRL